MSHKLIYKQTQEEFRAETRKSKALLEDLIGKPVQGYRAASFSIVKKSLWALDELIDAGFTYDSSVFPISHDNYGMPDAELEPYEITAPSGRKIVEFPMSIVNWGKLKLPVSGGGYFRIFPYWITRKSLARINEHEQRPFVFYLHPWEIDPGQPRVAGVDAKSRFRHYVSLHRTENRLERLLQDFRWDRVDRVFDVEARPAALAA